MTTVSARSLQVLHAIVADYVANNEPVGSKTIVSRYALGVSAATIRNDMALLEEAQLVTTPHTSAGRIPTDKGFRLYVDTLAKQQPLSRAQKAAIAQFLGQAESLDEALERAARMLAQLTNQVAVIQYPQTANVQVRHLDLVPLSSTRLLSVLIAGNGLVTQQQLELNGVSLTQEFAQQTQQLLCGLIVGKDLETASLNLEAVAVTVVKQYPAAMQQAMADIFAAVSGQLIAGLPAKLQVSGTANVSRAGNRLTQVERILTALEEQVTLLQLFNELSKEETAIDPLPENGKEDRVKALIGSENAAYGLDDAAILAGDYATGYGTYAKVGVLGPVRMDYAANMAAVRAVARYLSKLLG